VKLTELSESNIKLFQIRKVVEFKKI